MTEAKATGFDLAAAIPVLKANPMAQPHLDNFVRFRRHSTTKIYKLVADRAHSLRPKVDFRLNDWTWFGQNRQAHEYGLHLEDIKGHIHSVRIMDYAEQVGDYSQFGKKSRWIELNRAKVGPGVPILTAIAPRLKASPALIHHGIKISVDKGCGGITLGQYDGAVFSNLRAVREGLAIAEVPGFAPVLGMEAEKMSLAGYVVDTSYIGEKCIKLTGTTPGTASAAFTGASGTYDALLSFADEKGGRGTLALHVGGKEVSRWVLDADLSCWTRKTVKGIPLKKGDAIRLVGTPDQGESVRVDFLEFRPAHATGNLRTPRGSGLPVSGFSVTRDRGQVRIVYSLPQTSDVQLKVSSTDGRTVRILESGRKAAGRHELLWGGHAAGGIGIPEGMHVLTLRTGNYFEDLRF